MAPTNTAIECVSGRVGKNCDRRIVGASADSAGLVSIMPVLPLDIVGPEREDEAGIVERTEFNGIRREMIRDWVLHHQS
jgi:hypothetical protein